MERLLLDEAVKRLEAEGELAQGECTLGAQASLAQALEVLGERVLRTTAGALPNLKLARVLGDALRKPSARADFSPAGERPAAERARDQAHIALRHLEGVADVADAVAVHVARLGVG